MSTRNCSEVICDTLEQLGVRTVFGMPGTQNVPLFEALGSSKLRTIVTTNELAATFAANGYYRASGHVGVVTTIPGPGFTFALTGLTEAYLDSAAILILVPSSGDGSQRKFQHQHIDMRTMAGPITKGYFRVDQIEELSSAIARGYRLAEAGEPGPVMVEFNSRLFAEQTGQGTALPEAQSSPVDPSLLASVAEAISQAKRIVLFVGQGGQQCPNQISSLATRLGAVVVTTNSGRGVISESNPFSLYYDYSYGGGETVNELIHSCDLVLALGCKFSHNGSGGFALRIPKEKLIHVDSAANVLTASYPARYPVQADVKIFVDAILPLVTRPERLSGWNEAEVNGWRGRIRAEQLNRLRETPSIATEPPISCEKFFEQFRAALPDNVCLITDSGYHQVLTRMYFPVRSPRGLITPSDFQSMGFGLPAAIGAALAAPSRPVFLIIGDGGMAISGLELLTGIREQINLTVVIFNDGYLNLIRLRQVERGSEDQSTRLRNPDFSLLADSLGANYFSAEQGLDEAVRACLTTPGVNVLELFLSDPSGMGRRKVAGRLKRRVRKAAGAGVMNRLKRLLG